MSLEENAVAGHSCLNLVMFLSRLRHRSKSGTGYCTLQRGLTRFVRGLTINPVKGSGSNIARLPFHLGRVLAYAAWLLIRFVSQL